MTFAEIMQLKGKEAGLSFTAQQLEQFSAYYELLVETNKVMNLTAITEPEEVAVKHMIDSLLAFDEKLFGEKTPRAVIYKSESNKLHQAFCVKENKVIHQRTIRISSQSSRRCKRRARAL